MKSKEKFWSLAEGYGKASISGSYCFLIKESEINNAFDDKN